MKPIYGTKRGCKGIRRLCAEHLHGVPATVGFVDTWNSTIKKADLPLYGWEANPYVWVIKFERIEM